MKKIDQEIVDAFNAHTEKCVLFVEWLEKNHGKRIQLLNDGERERYLREFESLGAES